MKILATVTSAGAEPWPGIAVMHNLCTVISSVPQGQWLPQLLDGILYELHPSINETEVQWGGEQQPRPCQ